MTGAQSVRQALSMQLIAARTAGVRSAIRAARLVPALRTYATPATFKDDDDPQLADYPRLPYISKQRRPARGWEDWQMRRNFGEPVSSHFHSVLYDVHLIRLLAT